MASWTTHTQRFNVKKEEERQNVSHHHLADTCQYLMQLPSIPSTCRNEIRPPVQRYYGYTRSRHLFHLSYTSSCYRQPTELNKWPREATVLWNTAFCFQGPIRQTNCRTLSQAEWLAFLFRIREALGSNFGNPDTCAVALLIIWRRCKVTWLSLTVIIDWLILFTNKWERRESRGTVVRDIASNGEKQREIFGYEGSQAAPARPFW
jgi:hypothetical protein